MKHLKIVLAVTMLCAFLMFGLTALAQEQQGPPPGAQQRRGMQSPQERADNLAKELTLTDDQKKKVLTALEDQQKQRQALMGDTSLSQEDRMTKMREISTKTNDAIKAVLNDEQKKKYDESMQRRRGPGGPGGPGGPPQGPPPGF